MTGMRFARHLASLISLQGERIGCLSAFSIKLAGPLDELLVAHLLIQYHFIRKVGLRLTCVLFG